MRLLPYEVTAVFPADQLQRLVYQTLSENKNNRVAMLADPGVLEQLPKLDSAWLNPETNYYWTGIQIYKGRRADKRVIEGTYEDWFQWYMRSQRFRAFNTLVLINPLPGVSDEERGGYIDGFLARLMGKVQRTIIFSGDEADPLPSMDESRAREVIRALLYGTRLTRPELLRQLRRTFVPIADSTLDKVLTKYEWRISKDHPRYVLDDGDEELLEGMVKHRPWRPGYEGRIPVEVERLFRREHRFKRELDLADELLSPRVLEDMGSREWVTAPFEAKKLNRWLEELNRQGDPILKDIFRSQEHVSDEQWVRLLSPTRAHVRTVLESLVEGGKLERRKWYREVGRPAFAYVPVGRVPFLESRCGQCAFYIPVKRRCSLWHLANWKAPFFHPRWRQPGSNVTEFEIHKMRHASRIGPHSSACRRFLDKKRDHLRKSVPETCEICGEALPYAAKGTATCRECGTRYGRYYGEKSKWHVSVMTAYRHEFARVYQEATGDDAAADLEAYRREVKENIQIRQAGMRKVEDIEDALAEDVIEAVPEPPRVWPDYNKALQEKVDGLLHTTDIARRFSISMAQSATTAIERIVSFAKIYHGDAEPLLARQEKYLALIKDAPPSKLLPYEAQIMKQYWFCYALALRGVPDMWIGPRKKSRFVREFARNPSERARGYSPVDAAINYLHQRRLRQAERINQEAGFPGTCDGFLHREQYNSRKIGLLLDMIDPFKFVDREELLLVLLNQGLSWRDFTIEKDRRGSSFYYPTAAAVARLNQVGSDADDLVVQYMGVASSLADAYGMFASSLLTAIEKRGFQQNFEPFAYTPA